MPKMVTVVPDPTFSPSNAEEKKRYEGLKPQTVAWVQAIENVRAFKGMLMIAEEAPSQGEASIRRLEDMSAEELKIMMLTLGIRPTKKKMDRSEIITSIRTKMDALEVEEDDAA